MNRQAEARALIDVANGAKLGEDVVTVKKVFGPFALVENGEGKTDRVEWRWLEPAAA